MALAIQFFLGNDGLARGSPLEFACACSVKAPAPNSLPLIPSFAASHATRVAKSRSISAAARMLTIVAENDDKTKKNGLKY